MDDPVTSPITTEEHKTTFHSVKDKTRCHFQSKTYVQVHKDTTHVGRQLFLHGSEMLQTHRQVNNDAAYGRFGDFALR